MNNQQGSQFTKDDHSTEQLISVGQTLREAREKMGMSVNDVANRIKFAPRQIDYLETDDYTQLPEAAFVRGFVRSYARLLGLDAMHLLSCLPSSHVKTASTSELKSVDIPIPSSMSARRQNIIWLGTALLLAVSLAIFERYHGRGPAPEALQSNLNASTQTIELPNVLPDGVSAPVVSTDQVQESTPQQSTHSDQEAYVSKLTISPVLPEPVPVQKTKITPTVSAPIVVQKVKPAAPEPEPAKPSKVKTVSAVPEVKTPPHTPATVTPKTTSSKPAHTSSAIPLWQPYLRNYVRKEPAGPGSASKSDLSAKSGSPKNPNDRALRLEFDEDAWVEVKDGTDKILVSKKYAAGSLVRISGKAPMQITIGNAKSVRLFDNGKKIKLDRFTTADVARVKIK